MSDRISKDDEFTTVPAWVWWSCVPLLGAFSIIYAGVKINNNRLLLGGFGLLLSGLIIGNIPDKPNQEHSTNPLILVHWTAQMATAFCMRKKYLEVIEKHRQNTLNQNRKNQQNVSSQDIAKALIDVQELHKKGIITAEEYEGKRQELLVRL